MKVTTDEVKSITCSKCRNGIMLQRDGRYGKFLGCSNYPKCKNTQQYSYTPAAKEVKPYEKINFRNGKIQLSHYQEDILDFALNSDENLVVTATAGSGKSFILQVISQEVDPGLKTMYATFDKRSVSDIKHKLPPYVHASTWHSFGYKQIRRAIPNIRMNKDKNRDILNEVITEYDGIYQEMLRANYGDILGLVSKAKNVLNDDFRNLATGSEIVFDGDEDLCIEVVRKVYHQSVEKSETEVDFDDMIFLPATGRVPVQREYDLILCDESQDLNISQIEVIKCAGNRMIIVGDRNQAIYLFRGADSTSMDILKRHFNARTLPLSITYRNPKSHVDYINGRLPHITHEFNPSNPEMGSIAEISEWDFINQVKENDLVLCRINAPLVPMAFQLIKKNIPAYVAGRDIGQNLLSLVTKVEKKANDPNNLYSFLGALNTFTMETVLKLERLGKNATFTLDQRDTLAAIAEVSDSTNELKNKILTLFADDRPGVALSTVHKAKGSEADNVYIISPDKMPLPKGDPQEENNVLFVALSRAKKSLAFVQ